MGKTDLFTQFCPTGLMAVLPNWFYPVGKTYCVNTAVIPPPGQVVHIHVPISSSSTIWYRPKLYVGEVWPTADITELCLQLTAGSEPCKWK